MGFLIQHSEHISRYLISCTTALIITIFVIFLLKPLAIRIKLVDVPGGRKTHEGDIPLTGGIGMFLGFIFALLTLDISLSEYRSFIAASGLLVLVGLLDDLHELSAKSRFLAQILAAVLMATWGHVYLSSFGNLLFFGNISLEMLAIPITVFAAVGVINAVNMIDGVDGLAGSLVLVQLLLLAFLSFMGGNAIETTILAVLSASLCGFLIFNLPVVGKIKTSTFMGDSGSMFLGFALVWFLIHLSQENQVAQPVTMLWIMAIPLFDTLRLLWQRTRNTRSPFKPARDHLHHILMEMGFSSRHVIIWMGLANLSIGLCGIVGSLLQVPEGCMFVGFLLLFVAYCWLIQRFEKSVGLTKKFDFMQEGLEL